MRTLTGEMSVFDHGMVSVMPSSADDDGNRADAEEHGVAGVLTDAEQAVEGEEDGTPVARVIELGEVEGGQDVVEVGERDCMRWPLLVELTEHVAETSLHTLVDGTAGEGTETLVRVPPLECSDEVG